MTREEFKNTRKHIEKKALELRKHENKNDAITGVPLENYRLFQISGRKFISVQNNTFKAIADEFLVKAQDNNPEKFGTGEAHDVIEALRLVNPLMDIERFTEFLSHERFTYIFESEIGEVVDRILRLDLFRLIKRNSNGKNEFIGGLFHAFKHFSRNGINYSTGKGGHNIENPQCLIGKIINAFFSAQGVFETPDQYVVLHPIDNMYNFKFVFYREGKTGIFFLKTVYMEKK